MQRTLGRGLLLSLSLLFCLLVVNAGLSYQNTKNLHHNASWVAHTHEVLGALEELLSTIRDAESGQRGYLITGDDRYLKPYTDALAAIDARISHLQQLTADNANQQARIGPLEELISARRDLLARAIVARQKVGFEAARDLILTDDGRRAMDSIQSRIREMQQQERRLLAERSETGAGAYRFGVLIGLFASTLALAGVAGFTWILHRHIASRSKAEAILHEHRERQSAALVEADTRKDEFLATLAHELRNPLAPLANAIEIMKLADDDPTAVREARDVMERQLQQVVRLVDDLLDVSRISRNKLELRKQPVELSAVIDAALETSRPLMEQVGHHVTVVKTPGPIWLDADKIRLAQVFSNLLNNAARYTAAGGRIALTVERRGNEAVVRVSDSGVGIDAANLPRIFEMFAQADPAVRQSQGGLGIGLTLVRRLTEMHGGAVEVRSDGLDRGSEFTIRLPIATSSPLSCSASPEIDAEKSSNGRQFRILVVDDNHDSAATMAHMLQMTGHAIEMAHDGLEAVDRTAAFKPEIILLDVGLPKMDGHAVARKIKEQSSSQSPVIIAMTGWGQEEDKRRSKEAGFDHHLVKPVDSAVLRKLLVQIAASNN